MDDLVDEIRQYCAAAGIRPTTFGAYAVGDGKLIRRLEAGGEIMPRTTRKIRAFIAENPPKTAETNRGAA